MKNMNNQRPAPITEEQARKAIRGCFLDRHSAAANSAVGIFDANIGLGMSVNEAATDTAKRILEIMEENDND